MINKKLLFNILEIQSHSRECEDMQSFILDHAEEKGYTLDMDEMGNIYLQKGENDTYPCVVAHMDTVHMITKHGIQVAQFVGDPDIVFGMNPNTHRLTGIGGDDKCGIYAALHCLEVLPFAKAAFFVDEEIGCVGSNQANITFFEDCRFILQADRRGNNDFVRDICGPLGSKKFHNDVKEIIKLFGYSFSHGAMTDVEALRDNGVGISVANMSAGYYNPHSESEYINLRDLENVCNMMVDIFENMTEVYKFEYKKPSYKYAGRVQTFPPRAYGVPNQRYEDWWQVFDEEGNLRNPVIIEEEEGPYEEDAIAQQDMEAAYYGENDITEIPNADMIIVGGKAKNIAEMTDSEWETFERECDDRNPPVNPMLLTEHRTTHF
jgi:tripeptide aminopeptidase